MTVAYGVWAWWGSNFGFLHWLASSPLPERVCDKTSKVFFVLIFAVFLRDFIYFFVPQWHSHPSFIKIRDVFDLYTPQNQNVHCVVSSNDQILRKRFCSRGVAWTRPPKSRPNRSHRKRSYSISNSGNMIGCDHQSCVPVGSFAGDLWHFEYFPTTTVRQLLIFDHMTVIAVLTCCCIPNFIKIGSRVRPPDAHNCRMFNALLLGNGRCHGNRIMGTCRGHDGMWPPKLGLSWSIGRRIMAFLIFSDIEF